MLSSGRKEGREMDSGLAEPRAQSLLTLGSDMECLKTHHLKPVLSLMGEGGR